MARYLPLLLVLAACLASFAWAQTIGFEVEDYAYMYMYQRDPYRGYSAALNNGTESRKWVAKTLSEPTTDALITWLVGQDAHDAYSDQEMRTTPMKLADYKAAKALNQHLNIFKAFSDWYTATLYPTVPENLDGAVVTRTGNKDYTVTRSLNVGGDKLKDGIMDAFVRFPLYHVGKIDAAAQPKSIARPQCTFSLHHDKVSPFIEKQRAAAAGSFTWAKDRHQALATLLNTKNGDLNGLANTANKYQNDAAFRGFVQMMAVYARDVAYMLNEARKPMGQIGKESHPLYLRGEFRTYYRALPHQAGTDDATMKLLLKKIFEGEEATNRPTNDFIDHFVGFVTADNALNDHADHLPNHFSRDTGDTIVGAAASTIYIELRSLSNYILAQPLALTPVNVVNTLQSLLTWMVGFQLPDANFLEVAPSAIAPARLGATRPAWLKKFGQ